MICSSSNSNSSRGRGVLSRNATKVFNAESFRRRREAEYAEQRRERREAFIAKRRNIDGVLRMCLAQESRESERPSKQRYDQAVSLISGLLGDLSSPDPQRVLAAVTQIKSIISTGKKNKNKNKNNKNSSSLHSPPLSSLTRSLL